MRTINSSQIISVVAISLLLLLAVACHKETNDPKTPTGESSAEPKRPLSPEKAKQERLAWNLATLVEAYEHAGHTNPKWDEPAKLLLTEFARTRAQVVEPNEPSGLIISTNAEAVVRAGCDDPMVKYLFIRYSMDATTSPQAFTDAFLKMAEAMEKSSYPPIRKFYAEFRATQHYARVNNWPTNQPKELSHLQHQMIDQLSAVLADANTPAEEIYDACHEFLHSRSGNKEFYPKYWESMEPLLFKHWPNALSTWLLKGEANITLAWQARGNSTADKVTGDGWKLFQERLAIAENALTNAWALAPSEPRIAEQMLHVELGQGQGRDRMELWFNRAMESDPGNYTACRFKLNYLEPKWYGSKEDMLEFGRECVRNKKWGGRVPLILVDAHVGLNKCIECRDDKSDQASYWKRPEVWNDIQSAYNRFFEINPDNTGYYHDYALHAYRAEQWDKLNELIPKLGPINYQFFGGKDAFNNMVLLAKQHAKR